MSSPKMPFCYGQPRLENELVALEPFEPSVHTTPFVSGVKAHREIFDYTPFPALDSDEDFTREVWEKEFVPSATACLYVVVDKVSGADFAGCISLFGTDQTAASTEIGVMIFPPFHGTHVARNAVGLVLLWLMDPPQPQPSPSASASASASAATGGLGLRRLEWQSHPQNERSRKFARRMGLEFEGILRWKKVFPGGKTALSAEALRVRNGTKEEVPGRHTAIYSVVWDEWDEKRRIVVAQMGRK